MEKNVFKISKSTFAFFSTSCIHTMFRNMTCHSAGIYRGAPPYSYSSADSAVY